MYFSFCIPRTDDLACTALIHKDSPHLIRIKLSCIITFRLSLSAFTLSGYLKSLCILISRPVQFYISNSNNTMTCVGSNKIRAGVPNEFRRHIHSAQFALVYLDKSRRRTRFLSLLLLKIYKRGFLYDVKLNGYKCLNILSLNREANNVYTFYVKLKKYVIFF